MTISLGDIIEHNGEPWAVLELVRSVPLGFPPDALISRDGETLRLSIAALIAIASPTFEPGQSVKHNGQQCTVARDVGEFVEVLEDRPAPQLGPGMRQYVFPVARGKLVSQNLKSLVNDIGE
jgi:hypothetical protein